MKIALIILVFAIVAFIVLFFILGIISKSGKAPGLVGGTLSRCSTKPNCVCTEHKDDEKHYIDPIIISRNIALAPLPILKNVIRDMGGSVSAESENYIACTFLSSIFGFMDDFEIRIDSIQKVIHIRSASRVGHGDLGVNKKRADLFKRLYNKKVSEANPSPKATPKNNVN